MVSGVDLWEWCRVALVGVLESGGGDNNVGCCRLCLGVGDLVGVGGKRKKKRVGGVVD